MCPYEGFASSRCSDTNTTVSSDTLITVFHPARPYIPLKTCAVCPPYSFRSVTVHYPVSHSISPPSLGTPLHILSPSRLSGSESVCCTRARRQIRLVFLSTHRHPQHDRPIVVRARTGRRRIVSACDLPVPLESLVRPARSSRECATCSFLSRVYELSLSPMCDLPVPLESVRAARPSRPFISHSSHRCAICPSISSVTVRPSRRYARTESRLEPASSTVYSNPIPAPRIMCVRGLVTVDQVYLHSMMHCDGHLICQWLADCTGASG